MQELEFELELKVFSGQTVHVPSLFSSRNQPAGQTETMGVFLSSINSALNETGENVKTSIPCFGSYQLHPAQEKRGTKRNSGTSPKTWLQVL